ncbi:MAG: hypothetical protein WAW07_00330, partial [Bacteroidales bacterium]
LCGNAKRGVAPPYQYYVPTGLTNRGGSAKPGVAMPCNIRLKGHGLIHSLTGRRPEILVGMGAARP